MRFREWIFTCSLMLITACLLIASSPLRAQEEEDTFLFYYEEETPGQLDVLLLRNNICLEAVLRLNPGIDFNNLSYGQAFYIPVDEVCYQYNTSIYGYWNFYDHYPPRLKYYENGQWLEEPYYSDSVIYTQAESAEEIAKRYNICVDVLLADNILLQQLDAYKEYAWLSLDVFLPKNAPMCDPGWRPPTPSGTDRMLVLRSEKFNPLYFVEKYNLCQEEIYFGNNIYHKSSSNSAVRLPDNAPPCYDDAGRRLQYFDEEGKRRTTPRYTDWEVRIAQPGETLHNIAHQTGACLIDLVRGNGFPRLPAVVPVEILIPPARACPEDVKVRSVDTRSTSLTTFSLEFNVCPDILEELNPHFDPSFNPGHTGLYTGPSYDEWLGWLILPVEADPCYWEFHPEKRTSVFEVERELNVCHEEFVGKSTWYNSFTADATLYIPHQAPPCYNAQGQRLLYPARYPSVRSQTQPADVKYSEMRVHIFQRADTVYSVSREYNVCVRDLLKVNPPLVESLPTGYPTFIPITRPCYDEASGMPLIYEDENGQPLPQPKVSDQLIYYGAQPPLRQSFYYNVCVNRIEDANRDKIERRRSYLGWIIPTDRPPCYDQDGNGIDYVCYNEPVDFAVTDRSDKVELSLDSDGTYCYDLSNPETIIWHQNKPYKPVNYQGTMLHSRAFTAWCYGVSLEAINAINDEPEILEILPIHTDTSRWRVIPLPTRDCYLDNPEVMDGHPVYVVMPGDTLLSIARYYSLSAGAIAEANDLDADHTLWPGQRLIMPDDYITSGQSLYLGVMGLMSLIVLFRLGYRHHRRRSD